MSDESTVDPSMAQTVIEGQANGVPFSTVVPGPQDITIQYI